MLNRHTQRQLEEAYSGVGDMIDSPSGMLGKPVMLTIDMPGAEIDQEECCDDKLSDFFELVNQLKDTNPDYDNFSTECDARLDCAISDIKAILRELGESDTEEEDMYVNLGYEDI